MCNAHSVELIRDGPFTGGVARSASRTPLHLQGFSWLESPGQRSSLHRRLQLPNSLLRPLSLFLCPFRARPSRQQWVLLPSNERPPGGEGDTTKLALMTSAFVRERCGRQWDCISWDPSRYVRGRAIRHARWYLPHSYQRHRKYERPCRCVSNRFPLFPGAVTAEPPAAGSYYLSDTMVFSSSVNLEVFHLSKFSPAHIVAYFHQSQKFFQKFQNK